MVTTKGHDILRGSPFKIIFNAQCMVQEHELQQFNSASLWCHTVLLLQVQLLIHPACLFVRLYEAYLSYVKFIGYTFCQSMLLVKMVICIISYQMCLPKLAFWKVCSG
jgi:hypothetical protein